MQIKINNMGMYDCVWVKCPKCGKENEFQSKSGDCVLDNFTLENCPEDVIKDINRHAPFYCECGAYYRVDIDNRKAYEIEDISIHQKIKQTIMCAASLTFDLYFLKEQKNKMERKINTLESGYILFIMTNSSYSEDLDSLKKEHKRLSSLIDFIEILIETNKI